MTDTPHWVAMGYIKGAFGVKGWVKIAASTEYTDSLLDYPEWRLSKDGQTRSIHIESGQLSGGELQVKFTDINDRDQAHALRGYTIEIAREQFAEPESDEYYWTDLIGLSVVNHENQHLGEVSNLMQTGAHDVLVVKGTHGQKLIPFVSQFIDTVDLAARTITVDWGLDY